MAIRRWFTFWLLAVAAVVAMPVTSVSQTPPIAFEDSTTAVLNLSGTDVVHVSVRNNSPTAQVVTGTLRLVDGLSVPVIDAFAVLQALGPVPPSQLATIDVVRRHERVLDPDGVYTGELTVTTGDGQQIVLPVKFEADAAKAAAQLVPALTAWEVTADRWWPSVDHKARGTELPLKPFADGSDAPTLDPKLPLGVLTDGHGQRVTVFGTLRPEQTSAHRAPAVRLSFVGLRGTGKFEGDIDLIPGDDKLGVVKLTLLEKDQWLLPAITIFIGLAFAWGIQRFVGVKRHLRLLRARAEAARDTLQKTPCLDGVSLSDLTPAHKDVIKSLNQLRDRSVLTIDAESQDFKDAVGSVERLELVAVEWPGRMGAAFKALREAIESAEALNSVPPPGVPDDQPPAFLATGKSLHVDVNVADVPDRLAKVEAMTELATRWGSLQQQLLTLGALIEAIEKKLSVDDLQGRRLLAKARRLLSGVRWDLWHAKDPADLKRRTALEELARVDEIVGRLSYVLTPTQLEAFRAKWDVQSVMANLPRSSLALGPTGMIVESLRAIFAKATQAEQSPQAVERRIRVMGSGIILLSVVLTIWGALVTQYFDKPFGTFRDYATLLVWGLGTTAALEAINSVFGKVISPLPTAPKDSAKADATTAA